MRVLRSAAGLFLTAALITPCLVFSPGLMHVFDVPKSAALEIFAVLAGFLALAGAGGSREKGARLWWLLWSLWAVVAAWFVLASQGHATFVGDNLGEFPVWYRFKQWLFEHWTFGLDLSKPKASEIFFRATEGLACLTLLERAWALRAWRNSILFWPARLGFSLAALWCLSSALSLRPDLASPTLLDWGSYYLVFVGVWLLAREPRARGKVLAAILFAAAANAVYGLAQSSGHDFLPWAETFNGRASGFFGNPDFLGGHLALVLPLALALALRPSSKPWRGALAWALTWLLAAALLASQTRGAWVAAALGCATACYGVHKADPGRLRKSRWALAASALILALGLLAFWILAPQAATARLGSSLSRDPEAGRRVFLMEKTAQISAAHPLLGVGPGNFRIWFPSVEVEGLKAQDYLSQPYIISEHGHNDFLQMAADAGWPAALLWAALCLTVLWFLARNLRRLDPSEGVLLAGCLGALVAVRIHGLANFPFQVLPTESTAWALAALGLGLLPEAERIKDVSESGAVRAPGGLPWLVAGLVLAATLLMVRGRQVFEDALWWQGAGELGLKRPQIAAPVLLKALGVDPREDRLWDLHGQAHFDHGDIWQAIGSLREARRLNPYNAETALRLGLALLENRIYDESYAVLAGATSYAPNFPDLWEPLMAASYQDKRYADCIQACDWMLYFHVHEEEAYTNKAAALGNLGNLQQAWLTLRQAEQSFPNSGKVQLNLAITYYKMGLRKEAIAAWKKASLLIPSDPQVDQLRKVLKPRT